MFFSVFFPAIAAIVIISIFIYKKKNSEYGVLIILTFTFISILFYTYYTYQIVSDPEKPNGSFDMYANNEKDTLKIEIYNNCKASLFAYIYMKTYINGTLIRLPSDLNYLNGKKPWPIPPRHLKNRIITVDELLKVANKNRDKLANEYTEQNANKQLRIEAYAIFKDFKGNSYQDNLTRIIYYDFKMNKWIEDISPVPNFNNINWGKNEGVKMNYANFFLVLFTAILAISTTLLWISTKKLWTETKKNREMDLFLTFINLINKTSDISSEEADRIFLDIKSKLTHKDSLFKILYKVFPDYTMKFIDIFDLQRDSLKAFGFVIELINGDESKLIKRKGRLWKTDKNGKIIDGPFCIECHNEAKILSYLITDKDRKEQLCINCRKVVKGIKRLKIKSS